jgi:hypothetical protein
LNPKTRTNYPVRWCMREAKCPRHSETCYLICFKFSEWKDAVAKGEIKDER